MKKRMWKMLWKMGKTTLWIILALLVLWFVASFFEIAFFKDNTVIGNEYSSWNFFTWALEFAKRGE